MSTLLLFDVDGTLTHPMKKITTDMVECLENMKLKGYYLAVVGGSNIAKIKNQLGDSIKLFDHVFAENGTVTYDKEIIVNESITSFLNDQYNNLMLNIMNELIRIDIPVRRGTFIELRNSCINVSPIGRNCSYDERIDFKKYDDVNHVRQHIINNLSGYLIKYDLTAVIGGMISFDIYPNGWDKTYCLKYLDKYDTIHFFGDNTHIGGNDNTIYKSDRTIGHTIENPEHLIDLLNRIH